MKKRFLALLLVLTLLVGLMPAALAADTVDVSALPEYTAGADTSAGAAYKISTEESHKTASSNPCSRIFSRTKRAIFRWFSLFIQRNL